ncbi:MAG: hypothetical protein JO293_01775, partial [Candidatus Eremiobacteraeota bacterium]|nr:hypothetical protein [Candidatus Eremiobacteraeota bacterium]
MLETTPAEALSVVAEVPQEKLLVLEPEARPGAATFAAAHELDPSGGILGGCGVEGQGVRFGSVFASVPFGPYEFEPFPLMDFTGTSGNRPHADAIDAVAPGAYLVDRAAFVEVGGFDPNFGSPWRVYDLCVRLREAGCPVRWDPRLAFNFNSPPAPPADAVDHRDFWRRWRSKLGGHFDVETPARGGIRRTVRLPLGQRETTTIKLPPVDVFLYGQGDETTPSLLRERTHVRLSAVRDLRGEPAGALSALGSALRRRSDRYIVLVDAARKIDQRWLERMLLEAEWAANVCAVREPGRTLLSLGRIPLDITVPERVANVDEAVEHLIAGALGRARIVRGASIGVAPPPPSPERVDKIPVSVIMVAQSSINFHRTSFEGIYAGDLGVDYHVVATPQRPDALEAVRAYPTLDLIVDDTKTLAGGLNAALARAQGEIVVVIGDEFYPPRRWVSMVREAFALRPDTGILGFSAVAVEGPQYVDTAYSDIRAFHDYAAQRRATMKGEAHLANRLAGL